MNRERRFYCWPYIHAAKVPERVFDILKPEVSFAIRLYAQVINDLVDKRVQIGLL